MNILTGLRPQYLLNSSFRSHEFYKIPFSQCQLNLPCLAANSGSSASSGGGMSFKIAEDLILTLMLKYSTQSSSIT